MTDGSTSVACYADADAGGGSSLRRDAYVAAWSVLLTCAAIAAYNRYVDFQVRRLRRQRKERKEEQEALVRKLDKKRRGAMADKGESSTALSLAHKDGMGATGNFLSAVLAQMWRHMNVAVSNSIKTSLEPTLKEMNLHFVRMDLGSVPIRMTNMFIHMVEHEREGAGGEKQNLTGIQMDMDVSWDGQADVMLQATLSKSAKLTFGVEKIKLSGRMSVLLGPLTTEIPVVSAAQYGFTNPPSLDIKFSGAASVLNKMGIVQSRLPALVSESLAGVLVLPQRLVMPVDPCSYDFLDTYRPPVGMVRITVVGGSGFKVQQKLLLKDIPDVYCKISLGASKAFKTSTKDNDLEPSWKDESCDFILYDMDQKIYVHAMDEDLSVEADDELGGGEISVRDLFKAGCWTDVALKLDGEENGCSLTLSAELFHLSNNLNSFSSSTFIGENKLCGLLTIIVTKGFGVPLPKEDAATYVKVVYGEGTDHEREFFTGAVEDAPGYDALNPMYDCVFHVPINTAMMARKKDRGKNNVTFTMIDGDGANGTKGHGELGKFKVTHEALCEAYKHTITRTSPIGNQGAKLEYMIRLNGMQTEEEFSQRVPDQSIGASSHSMYGGMDVSGGTGLRITAVRGRGFKVRSRLIKKDDVPDVYCKIRLRDARGDAPWWRTKTIKDDTMPQWGESKDFDGVRSQRAAIIVETFDENKKGTDDFLGRAEFSVEQLLRKRLMEVELKDGPDPTDRFVTLRCVELELPGKRAVDRGDNVMGPKEEVLVHYQPDMGDGGYESTLLEEPTASPRGMASPSCEVDLRVTALRGRGFQARKHRFSKSIDIPDIYLKIRVVSPGRKEEKSRWKTATIKDNYTPEWNESKNYAKVHRERGTVRVDAYENNKLKDDFIGGADFPVERLLQKGTMEVELQKDSTLTKTFVTLKCAVLESSG